MSRENDYLTCVDKLEQCVHEIRRITSSLAELSDRMNIKDSIATIEEQAELIRRTLTDEIIEERR